MNIAGKTFLFFIILSLCTGGCCSIKHPSIKTTYYTLEYDAPKFADLPQLPFILRVERFSVAPIYNSNRIVYKEKQFRRDAYNYHKWQANPVDLITYSLTNDLKHSALFKAVFSHDSSFSSTHVIEGTVDEFFEQDGNDYWEAVFSVSITLIAENEPEIKKRVLFQKKYRLKKTCNNKNPQALAEAMSNAVKGVSEMIIIDTYNYLSGTMNTSG